MLSVRGKPHTGHIVCRVGKRRHDSPSVHLVQGLAYRGITFGREIDISLLLIDTEHRDAPVGTVCKTPELSAVVGEEVNLLP